MPPSLTLLSVVGAEAATLCSQGTVSLSRYAWFVG